MSVLVKGSSQTTVNTVETNTSTIQSYVTSMITKLLSGIDFWSEVDNSILLPAVAADTALPSVVVSGLPTSISLARVVAFLKIRAIENTAAGGPNAIDGEQYIQVRKTGGAWSNAIVLADNQWTIAASTREAGDVLIGDIDLKSIVDEDETYEFQFADALVDLVNLELNDVIVGLRFFFKLQ